MSAEESRMDESSGAGRSIRGAKAFGEDNIPGGYALGQQHLGCFG